MSEVKRVEVAAIAFIVIRSEVQRAIGLMREGQYIKAFEELQNILTSLDVAEKDGRDTAS